MNDDPVELDFQPGRAAAPQLDVTVTVDKVDAEAMFDRAAYFVAMQMLERYGEKRSIEKRVSEMFAEMLEARLSTILASAVEEAINKPIPKTDVFGQPIGEPTSLAHLVESAGQRFLTELIDRNGKPVDRNHWPRSESKPRIDWMVEGVALAGIEKELKAEAARIKEQLTAKAKEAVATLLSNVRL